MRKPLHALGERCEAGASGAVIPVDIAAAKAIVAAVPVAETETLDLLAANGRVLATDVVASLDLPPFDLPRWMAMRWRPTSFRDRVRGGSR